jgi:hypothetical protein
LALQQGHCAESGTEDRDGKEETGAGYFDLYYKGPPVRLMADPEGEGGIFVRTLAAMLIYETIRLDRHRISPAS